MKAIFSLILWFINKPKTKYGIFFGYFSVNKRARCEQVSIHCFAVKEKAFGQ